MNRKKSLEIIRDYHNQISLLCKGKLNNKIINAENQIEKDLEVLEILKKHIYLMSEVKAGDTIISQSLGMSLDSRVNDNDFIKVKEWLEND